MRHLVAFALQFLLPLILRAADSTIVSFSIGNQYAFAGSIHCLGAPFSNPLAYTETIVSDTILGGRMYFKFVRSEPRLWSPFFKDTATIAYRRADSTSIYQFNIVTATEETIIDFGDTIGTTYGAGYQLTYKDTRSVFATNVPVAKLSGVIEIAAHFFLVAYLRTDACVTQVWLEGARIDGILYGDQTVLSEAHDYSNASNLSDCFLFQNYPNPFNPTTIIGFYVPHGAHVRLRVFDVLGRDVALLVDEVVDRGYHTVEFDGVNLASGIYYYSLQSDVSVQAKRLLLLK
ncbi:MAG: T9SS type A sorting domain-containing protein [Bacteroidota bacterium]